MWTRPEPQASSPAGGKDSCWTGGVTASSGPQHRSRGDGYPRGPRQFGGLSVLTLRPEKNLFKLVVLLSWPSQSSDCHPFRSHWCPLPTLRCLPPIPRSFQTGAQTHPKLGPSKHGLPTLAPSKPQLASGYCSGYFYHCTLNPVLTFETFLSG